MRWWTEVRILNSNQVLYFLGLWPWAITCLLSRKLFLISEIYNPMAKVVVRIKDDDKNKELSLMPSTSPWEWQLLLSVKWLLLIKLLIDLSQVPFVFVERIENFFPLLFMIRFLYFFFKRKILWTDKNNVCFGLFFLLILPPTCCFFFPLSSFWSLKVRYLHSYQFVTEELDLTREFLLAFGVKTKISYPL